MAKRTADTVIAGAKVRTLLPGGELTYTNQELLNLATDEILSYIAPKIQQVRQSYFTAVIDVPIVKDVFKYRIPYRSIGGAIKEVKKKNSTTGSRLNLPLYSLGELNGRRENRSEGIAIDGAHLQLVGSQNLDSYDILEITIYMRPSQLVPVNQAAQVVAINSLTVTVNTLPSSLLAGVKIDFIKSEGLNDIYAFDQPIQNIDAGNLAITFASLPDDIEVGDYIALAGETPVPNIPLDFYPLLEQRLAVKILEGLGDTQKSQAAQQKAQELETYLIATIVPRIEEEEPIIVQDIFDGFDYYR